MNADEIKIGSLLNNFLKKNNLEKGLDKVDAKDAWFKIMENGVEFQLVQKNTFLQMIHIV